MWHKQEVYMTVKPLFSMAWREFIQMHGASIPPDEKEAVVWNRCKEQISDEVASQASVPSFSSRRVVVEHAMHPWKRTVYTKDDGVQDMPRARVRRICLGWLERHYNV